MKPATQVASIRASMKDPMTDACQRGDRDALARVFRKESPGLERMLSRLVASRAEVEDLLQETFIEAILAFPRFRGETSVHQWMTRIAVRLTMAHIRHPTARPSGLLEAVEADDEDPQHLSDDQLAARRQLERFRFHLNRLPAHERAAFVLHVFDGRSIAEVATLMNATRWWTRLRVFLARHELLHAARRDPVLQGLPADEAPP